MYSALKLGRIQCFIQLYLYGAKIIPQIPYNGTPLHFAVNLQHFEFVKTLLREHGTFPNYKNMRDERGWTPLHIAAANGDA